jgi:hypothetical protein
MLQPGGDLDFALESVDVDARRQLWRQYLDDDLSAERRLVGYENPRHAATTQLAFNRIRAAE